MSDRINQFINDLYQLVSDRNAFENLARQQAIFITALLNKFSPDEPVMIRNTDLKSLVGQAVETKQMKSGVRLTLQGHDHE